jgi:hypothetical protein
MIAEALRLPRIVSTKQHYHLTRGDALALVLHRFARPSNLLDIAKIWERQKSFVCASIHKTLEVLHEVRCHSLLCVHSSLHTSPLSV